MKEKTAFFIGRFAPPHKGHINVIENLLKEYDKVVIGLGSCYELGTARHPFPALNREKMILQSLKDTNSDLSKLKIVYIQDFITFEEWIDHVLKLCEIEHVTHFVTGNKEDILSVIEEKKILLPFEFVNPEANSEFNFHASDMRKSIIDGDYKKFEFMASTGTLSLMGQIGGFNLIRKAIENRGNKFFGGRQTVDLVFTLTDVVNPKSSKSYEETYLLTGIRSKNKPDFPNWLGLPGDKINDYEAPDIAALRALKEKTGIVTEFLDRSLEPSHILIKTPIKNIIAELKYSGLYSSNNIEYSGVFGGSSQCFHIHLDGNLDVMKNCLNKIKGGLKLVRFRPISSSLIARLPYEQPKMVEDISYKKYFKSR